MDIDFKHLGPMQAGHLTVADLTLICGDNNSGKTWLTYLIYSFCSTWTSFANLDFSDELQALLASGTTEIDLQAKIADQWQAIGQRVTAEFIEEFPAMQVAQPSLFAKLKLHIALPLGSRWFDAPLEANLHGGNKRKSLLKLQKPASSATVELIASAGEEGLRPSFLPVFNDFVKERLLEHFLSGIIPDAFIVTTERTGTITFRKQLNLALTKLVDLLGNAQKDNGRHLSGGKAMESLFRAPEYPLAVQHNVQFVNALPGPGTADGPLCKLHPELLAGFESIVGGTYLHGKEGQTRFLPAGSKVKLGMGEVSSSVRALMLIWYWLKYIAAPGNLLMIDEPELNLHPTNQRRLARFLATLVRHGVKVFLTTHSDYIVREFNTLIMLAGDGPHLAGIRQQFGYGPDEALPAQRTAAYLVSPAGHGFVFQPIDITPQFGMAVESFDSNIDQMNAMQEAIYYGGDPQD